MNLLGCVVTKVISAPIHRISEHGDYWYVAVESECYGDVSETRLIFNSKEEAEKVAVGFRFLG